MSDDNIHNIHEAALPRLAEQPDGEGIRHVMEALIAEAEEEGRNVGQVCIPFIEDGDDFVVGTWVPEFWIIVRKVLPGD